MDSVKISQRFISKSQYIYHEILVFLTEKERIVLQQLSKRFYERVIPNLIQFCSIKNQPHARIQNHLFQYACGAIMYKTLSSCIEGCPYWQSLYPSNEKKIAIERLNKRLAFSRTIYLPYNRIIIISGSEVSEQANYWYTVKHYKIVRDVFQFHLLENTVEKLPSIKKGRSSFAAHYDFGDRYIYVIGG